MITKFRNFLTEILVELKKVSWPTKNELIGSTAVVIIGVAVMAIYIGICDFIFSKSVHLVIR